MSAAANTGPRGPLPLQGALVKNGVGDLVKETGTTSESPTQLAISRLKENRLAQVAAVIFIVMVLLCLSVGFMESHWAGRSAYEANLSGTMDQGGKGVEVVDIHGIPGVGPGFRKEYTLGADYLGRDVFMRVLRGGGVSLMVGLGAAIITTVLGLAIGIAAGFFGGRIDAFISRTLDVLIAFPALVFAIALSTALASSGGFLFIKRGSPMLPLLIIGVLGAFPFARIIRAKAMELAGQEFVEAARALGAGNVRIMVNEMLPHLTTTVITWFGLIVSANIIAEAGLSFLGVGVLPPTPSWGNIISDGRIFYSTAWWISLFPGLMIAITVLSLNIVGEALEEALDPKSKGR